MSKKILIIGNSANAYALAKKLSGSGEIFVAPGSDAIREFATCVDIREDSEKELLEFAVENGIDLTIPFTKKSVETNIAEIFSKNDLKIFAPSNEAARIVLDKSLMKKTLYKLRIPTPKFGIFEKQNMAADYVKNLKSPFVIKTKESSSAVILTSTNAAKQILDSFFVLNNQKVIIEDYIWGTPFNFYVVTDGYKALPLGSSIIYKHSLEGDGGQLTTGMGACSPNYKLTIENEYFLMDNVVYPILEYLEASGSPYVGILGINGILSENGNINIIDLDMNLQDCDCSAILSTVDADLYSLFESCVIGSFSDEVEYIPQNNLSATTVVLTCKNKDNLQNVITGINDLDDETLVDYYSTTMKNRYLEFEASSGPVVALTSTGRTITSSTSKVYSEAQSIDFKGLFYRKDVCKPQISEL